MNNHVPRQVSFECLCAAVSRGDGLSALPQDVVRALQHAPGPLVLTDFAGRDSVAAAMAWMEDHPGGTLLPVGDLVPARYGDWSVYESNWRSLRDQVASRFPKVLVAPWFVMADEASWHILAERHRDALTARFGFFTPCLGCHLHFYMMRAVLAHVVGAQVLVSGEKELHRNNRRKANQTREAVESYTAFSRHHGVDHQFPIHKVSAEEEMERLLGEGWREGERQLPCTASGNDRGPDGRLTMTPGQIRSFMEDFAVPLATTLVELRRTCVTDEALLGRSAETAEVLLWRAT